MKEPKTISITLDPELVEGYEPEDYVSVITEILLEYFSDGVAEDYAREIAEQWRY